MSRPPLLPRIQKTVYYETTEENNSIDTAVRIVQKRGGYWNNITLNPASGVNYPGLNDCRATAEMSVSSWSAR
jgi:hypothetical protein